MSILRHAAAEGAERAEGDRGLWRPSAVASRKLDGEAERLSIGLSSYGGFLFSWPARMKRADVSQGARNA